MIITIDGPAGTGKSTIAKAVAKALGFNYLDTGAMYRAITWYMLKNQVPIADSDELEKALSGFELRIEKRGDTKRYFVGRHEVTKEIRLRAVTRVVSIVAAHQVVRDFLVKLQHKEAELGNIVCEGRDIGSVVFPKAELKVFLTASAEERARRRFEELKAKGVEDINLSKIQEEIIERDRVDTTREHSPLIQAEDAIAIDTTSMTINEVVEKVLSLVK
ncbi:MAG: (d)CMP kinase [Simkaniaceae bacterium]|nr:(d)CMP kinase [Simkaniaceae bacterium]